MSRNSPAVTDDATPATTYVTATRTDRQSGTPRVSTSRRSVAILVACIIAAFAAMAGVGFVVISGLSHQVESLRADAFEDRKDAYDVRTELLKAQATPQCNEGENVYAMRGFGSVWSYDGTKLRTQGDNLVWELGDGLRAERVWVGGGTSLTTTVEATAEHLAQGSLPLGMLPSDPSTSIYVMCVSPGSSLFRQPTEVITG